jgi:glyoxylase-like metal-dependent hydrolase (beta-lactamase superfamily II)
VREVAQGVWQLSGFPRDLINAYLTDNVLIDCKTRWARRSVLRQLKGRPLSLVALTHCHPDHQGTARDVCTRFGIPLACHEADVGAMEGRVPMEPANRLVRFANRVWAGPPCAVSRVLREGDEVGRFRVVHAPGHTSGHVIYFRDTDRLAIAGDVLANIHFVSGAVGLRVPPDRFCVDARQNLRSIRILAELKPSVICFGHGPPVYDGKMLQDFVARLKD